VIRMGLLESSDDHDATANLVYTVTSGPSDGTQPPTP
jgi:hypothetical protein